MPIDSSKPRKKVVQVGTLGHRGHGKSTLTAALSRVCSQSFGGSLVDFSVIDAGSEAQIGSITVKAARVEYKSSARSYKHVDCVGHENCMKAFEAGEMKKLDAAVLVVSASDGPKPQTREHIIQCRKAGVENIIVFLNKADLVDDEELMDLSEANVREMLDQYDYPGDDTPFVVGAAIRALIDDDDHSQGVSAVKKLVEVLDDYIQ